jgi:predicted Zn-dependent peptidase
MLNRKISPQSYPIYELKPSPTVPYTLKNGIAVVGLNDPNLTLIRLDIRLKAGIYFQQKQAVSHATIKLITEGTKSMSSEQIAEELDYAGAYFEVVSDRDFSTFTIYFPKRAAEKIMPVVAKLFTEAIFPEDKIEILTNNMRKNLAINKEKTSYLAHSHFISHVFGERHPYGVSLQFADIDTLKREDIVDFYQQNFHSGNIRLFAAGDLDSDFLILMNDTLGQLPYKQPNIQNAIALNPLEGTFSIEKENAVQSSVCIGKRLFTHQHKDWIPMYILNTVLGGYFGSRLMTNIREEKGLTYGIYSRVQSFQLDGLFMIRADINKELVQQAVNEIYKELATLQKEPVPQEELELVKNYLYGSLLHNFDGVFSQIDRVIQTNDYNLSSDYWTQYMETVRNINSHTLQELACNYLDINTMTEIVSG